MSGPHSATNNVSPDIINEFETELLQHEAEPLLKSKQISNESTNITGETTTTTLPLPNNKSMHDIIKKLFKDKRFTYWFIFKILFFTQVFAAGLFIPLYAAEYFGGCLESNGIGSISGCVPNYSLYAYYATMFFSIAGLITFLISSFIGYLTDKYGRKKFFYLAIITWMIPRVVMIFYINFYLYFSLSLLEAINGGDFFIASKGYLADIIPKKNERIIGYGFGQSAVGIGCILGSVLAVLISYLWNDHTIFIALGIYYILLLVFTKFFITEPTNDRQNTIQFEMINPFKYLKKVFVHNLIFYLSLLSLLMSIVESGIMSSLFAYIGNEFQLSKEGNSTMTYGIFAVTMSVAVILTGYFLAIFKNFYDELNIMIIAICIKILSLLLLSFISMFPLIFKNYIVLYLSAFLYGTSFFIWPSITGLLTKYLSDNQQGTGFGIIDSWTAIANIIAPFSFGYLYVTLNKMKIQWILFLFAILFCIASCIIVYYPLKNTVKQQIKLLNFENNNGNHTNNDNSNDN
eukprot:56198_1